MWITRSKRKNVQAVLQAREQLMQRKRSELERSQSQEWRLCARTPHKEKDKCW